MCMCVAIIKEEVMDFEREQGNLGRIAGGGAAGEGEVEIM